MKRRLTLAATILVYVALILAVATPLSIETARGLAQSAPPVTVLRAARMLDVKAGAVINNPIVVVVGERITAAASGVQAPPGARVLDLGNVMLLPGLIDSHTHLLQNYDRRVGNDDPNMVLTVAVMGTTRRALLGAAMGRQDLEAGITTVRDLGNSGLNGDVALRDAINAGWVVGPRIIASTRALAPAGGQFGGLAPEAQKLIEQEYVVISGVEEARRAVRQAFYDGAEVIKVIVLSRTVMSAEELKAIVAEAHRVGRKVAAHTVQEFDTRLAALAGVDSIEHGYTVSDDVLRIMAEKKIFLVPTDRPADFYADTLNGLVTEDRQRRLAAIKESAAHSADRLQRAIRLGVRVAFGSDVYYGAPGRTRGQLSLMALQAYQEAGMPPLEVLRAATINSAELSNE